MHDYDPEIPTNLVSGDLFFKIFLEDMPPYPPSIHANFASHNMTTHHPKFSVHTALQLVGLTTEKLLLWPWIHYTR